MVTVASSCKSMLSTASISVVAFLCISGDAKPDMHKANLLSTSGSIPHLDGLKEIRGIYDKSRIR